MKKTILLLAAFMLTFVCSARESVHQHLTFDNGWSFRLCTDSADVISTLRKLGVNDSPYTTTKVEAKKTKVTYDTEPEQAQVTASEITRSSSQKAVGGGDFRSVQIPHDWSAELSFDPQVGDSAGYLSGGQGIYVKDFAVPVSVAKAGSVRLVFDGICYWLSSGLNYHLLSL